jgi:hypothetical protein
MTPYDRAVGHLAKIYYLDSQPYAGAFEAVIAIFPDTQPTEIARDVQKARREATCEHGYTTWHSWGEAKRHAFVQVEPGKARLLDRILYVSADGLRSADVTVTSNDEIVALLSYAVDDVREHAMAARHYAALAAEAQALLLPRLVRCRDSPCQ